MRALKGSGDPDSSPSDFLGGIHVKKLAMGVAGLLGLVVIVVGGVIFWAGGATQNKLDKEWPIEGRDFPIPFPLSEEEKAELVAVSNPDGEADGAQVAPDFDAIALERAVERGEYLVTTRLGCVECHGETMAGQLFVDAMPVWKWYPPNITKGGRTAKYASVDWDRLLRHGVKPDGTAALMPAADYASLSDREVADVATYVWSKPVASDEWPASEIGPLGKILIATGEIPIAAEHIDHELERPVEPPEAGVNLAYGKHITQVCVGCHRQNFSGGKIAEGPPDWPEAANLTPDASGNLKDWDEAAFIVAMRSGKRPDGSDIDPIMPWKAMAKMNDTDLKAMFLYLKTLKPLSKGS